MAEKSERSEKKERGVRKTRKKVCYFCTDKHPFNIDYKELKLRRFISERAKILPRRVSGTCAEHQRRIVTAIKRARILALMPYTNN